MQEPPRVEEKKAVERVMSTTEEEDDTMRIEISKNQRIDETIESMESLHKTKFAGELSEYIENNIDKMAQ